MKLIIEFSLSVAEDIVFMLMPPVNLARYENQCYLLHIRWVSILHHITNQHQWMSDSGYSRCAHEPLTDLQQRTKAWLNPGSSAHRALQNIVLDKRFLQNMDRVRILCDCHACK